MYVFLIGTGRCGSTLVHQLLARHPDVGFISNLEDRVPGLPASARRPGNALYRHAPRPGLGDELASLRAVGGLLSARVRSRHLPGRSGLGGWLPLAG